MSDNTAQFYLGTVTEVSDDGVKFILDGHSEALSKSYKQLGTGNALEEDDRIVIMKISGTYIVLGKVSTSSGGGGHVTDDTKVLKTGDTMTGSLIMRGTSINIDDTNIEVGTRPSSNQWTIPLRIRDSARKVMARIQSVYTTSGLVGIQLYADRRINGESKYNFLGINIDEEGMGSVTMNFPAAWRSALGLGTSGAFPLTVAQGGTGLTSSPSVLTNLSSTTAANILASSPRPGVTGTLPIGNGGTGSVATTTVQTLSDIMTVESGVTVANQRYMQWGKVAQIYLSLYKSSTFPVDANGNLTAVVANLGTIVAGKRPAYYTPLIATGNGSQRPFGRILNTGVIQLLGFEGTGAARTIAANTAIEFSATYILA